MATKAMKTMASMKTAPMKAAAKNVKKLTKTGQLPVKGRGCISTRLDGSPCPYPRDVPHLPHCKRCMRKGDPSLKIVKHPKFGKCLIAARDLPKGYKVIWYGKRHGNHKTVPDPDWEWALTSSKGIINARPFKESSLMAYAQCAGPSEIATLNYSPDFDVLLAKEDVTCLVFMLLCDLPKNHQVVHIYDQGPKTADIWFKERGIKRCDVGCKKFPAIKKPGM